MKNKKIKKYRSLKPVNQKLNYLDIDSLLLKNRKPHCYANVGIVKSQLSSNKNQ